MLNEVHCPTIPPECLPGNSLLPQNFFPPPKDRSHFLCFPPRLSITTSDICLELFFLSPWLSPLLSSFILEVNFLTHPPPTQPFNNPNFNAVFLPPAPPPFSHLARPPFFLPFPLSFMVFCVSCTCPLSEPQGTGFPTFSRFFPLFLVLILYGPPLFKPSFFPSFFFGSYTTFHRSLFSTACLFPFPP